MAKILIEPYFCQKLQLPAKTCISNGYTNSQPEKIKKIILEMEKCDDDELIKLLIEFDRVQFSSLYHWINVLNRFDNILGNATKKDVNNRFSMACDAGDTNFKQLVLNILHFTRILIKQCSSRNVYRSMDRLIKLLLSTDMKIIIAVLNILYTFAKDTLYLSRLSENKRMKIFMHLTSLAKVPEENSLTMAETCQNIHIMNFPADCREFRMELKQPDGSLKTVEIKDVYWYMFLPLAELMEYLIYKYEVPKDNQLEFYLELRLKYFFCELTPRILGVAARLHALTILALEHKLLCTNEELLRPALVSEVLELTNVQDLPIDVKVAAFKLLHCFKGAVKHKRIQEKMMKKMDPEHLLDTISVSLDRQLEQLTNCAANLYVDLACSNSYPMSDSGSTSSKDGTLVGTPRAETPESSAASSRDSIFASLSSSTSSRRPDSKCSVKCMSNKAIQADPNLTADLISRSESGLEGYEDKFEKISLKAKIKMLESKLQSSNKTKKMLAALFYVGSEIVRREGKEDESDSDKPGDFHLGKNFLPSSSSADCSSSKEYFDI